MTRKAILILEEPLRFTTGDFNVIFCRPYIDATIDFLPNSEFLNMGVLSTVSISTRVSNVRQIIMDTDVNDTNIDAVAAAYFETHGFVDLT